MSRPDPIPLAPPDLAPPWRTQGRAALQAEARAFARGVVLPVADELDREKAEMPQSLIAAMARKGWFGITIPKAHGGLGLGVFEYGLVSEELAPAWLSVGSILARGQGLGTQTTDPERRAALLARSAGGDWIGYQGFLTFELDLDGVRVPEGDRLTGLYGDQGADADAGGFASVQRGLDIARVHTAARAVGVAQAALEDTHAYLQERVQFGHPIGDFQALRFALADMAAAVAQARAFWHQVAHLLDAGAAAEAESAMVTRTATEMAVRVTNRAMQLHGGNGYTTERRVERYWRDARLTTIFEGTSEIQRRIVSDRMLPRA